MTPEELCALNDAAFTEVVAEDCRGRREAALRNRAVVERWFWTLTAMKRSLEHQLGARKAEQRALRLEMGDPSRPQWADSERLHNRWVAATLRSKSAVEVRLAEVASQRQRSGGDRPGARRIEAELVRAWDDELAAESSGDSRKIEATRALRRGLELALSALTGEEPMDIAHRGFIAAVRRRPSGKQATGRRGPQVDLSGLVVAISAREKAEQEELDEVVRLRRLGASWTAVGAAYGITRQAARERFVHRIRP